MNRHVTVVLYTIPQEACCFGKMTWSGAADMLKKQLHSKLGDSVRFRHVEFMTADWFADAHAQQLMESQNLTLPFVLIDGALASSGDKINISRVLRQAKAFLHPNT
jgi:hypothetical protein